MNGEALFWGFLVAAVASVVIAWREWAEERRIAEGKPTEMDLRRWHRRARKAWLRGRKERVP